jgi:hypothetical protein
MLAELPDPHKLVAFDRNRHIMVTMAENVERATRPQLVDLVQLLIEGVQPKDRTVDPASIEWTPAARPYFEPSALPWRPRTGPGSCQPTGPRSSQRTLEQERRASGRLRVSVRVPTRQLSHAAQPSLPTLRHGAADPALRRRRPSRPRPAAPSPCLVQDDDRDLQPRHRRAGAPRGGGAAGGARGLNRGATVRHRARVPTTHLTSDTPAVTSGRG